MTSIIVMRIVTGKLHFPDHFILFSGCLEIQYTETYDDIVALSFIHVGFAIYFTLSVV